VFKIKVFPFRTMTSIGMFLADIAPDRRAAATSLIDRPERRPFYTDHGLTGTNRSETCRMLSIHKAVLQLLRIRLIGDVLYLGIGSPSGPITLPF